MGLAFPVREVKNTSAMRRHDWVSIPEPTTQAVAWFDFFL